MNGRKIEREEERMERRRGGNYFLYTVHVPTDLAKDGPGGVRRGAAWRVVARRGASWRGVARRGAGAAPADNRISTRDGDGTESLRCGKPRYPHHRYL